MAIRRRRSFNSVQFNSLTTWFVVRGCCFLFVWVLLYFPSSEGLVFLSSHSHAVTSRQSSRSNHPVFPRFSPVFPCAVPLRFPPPDNGGGGVPLPRFGLPATSHKPRATSHQVSDQVTSYEQQVTSDESRFDPRLRSDPDPGCFDSITSIRTSSPHSESKF
jgi:hypothetical protein